MKKSLSKEVCGGGDHANLEREVTKINREYEEVIKDMDRMRIDFRSWWRGIDGQRLQRRGG